MKYKEESDMAKGGFPGGMGGMNMNNLMKQAQKMQKQMMEKQEELQAKEYEATAGGGHHREKGNSGAENQPRCGRSR